MRNLLYFSLFLCFSCGIEREIDSIKIPFEGEKLIILSFFNPHEFIEMIIHKAIAPDALPKNTVVDNAFVVLFEDNRAIDTLDFVVDKYIF